MFTRDISTPAESSVFEKDQEVVTFGNVDRFAKHNISVFCPSTAVMFFGFWRNSGIPDRKGIKDEQGAVRLSGAPCLKLSLRFCRQQQQQNKSNLSRWQSKTNAKVFRWRMVYIRVRFTARQTPRVGGTELCNKIDVNAVVFHIHTFTYKHTSDVARVRSVTRLRKLLSWLILILSAESGLTWVSHGNGHGKVAQFY